MDAATLQAKVYSGYNKAALRIGKVAAVFHPADPLTPITTSTVSVNAAFTQDFNFSKPNKYGNACWWCVADGSRFAVGDYLRNADGTWFVAGKQHLLPILVVECNTTISVFRVTHDTANGAIGYGGDVAANETTLMAGWPASVLQGTKGEKNPADLPQDERQSRWIILLPYYPGIVINADDIVTDNLNRRYIISGPELTDLGWRLTASLQGA